MYPFLQSYTHLLRKLSIIGALSTGKRRKTANTQITEFVLNLYLKDFFHATGTWY